MVHTNQQVLANRFDVGTQLRELLAVGPVAAKQNDAACERVQQALAVSRGELSASDVKNERGVVRHELTVLFNNTITGRVIRLVAHADVRAQAFGFKPLFEHTMQHDRGLTAG